jgi:tartrate-resistant acid phosphatase type 5
MHIFAIGDWGGCDGSLNPIEGRRPVIAYSWGKRPGPSVFPRSRQNKVCDKMYCSHSTFVHCFQSKGTDCEPGCGYVAGVDDQPQILVANAFKKRAALKNPQYILNVGDNFYWGGIEKTCGSTPMSEISYTAKHQFDQIYEGIYQGEGLTGKPWLSVLGNHDWGGFTFSNGWDQQIAYTWASERWVLPAPYWTVKVQYPDQDFSVDIYFLDSNFVDAKEPSQDSEHNICSSKHNKADADCSAADGPPSVDACPGYFREFWSEQKAWLEKLLPKSKATWQVVVTHFPCGIEQSWYKQLHEDMGLDLLVTGHRHDQELWDPADDNPMHKMGGLTCFVTGGGGGITSEATPDPENTKDWYGEAQYGFYDLTITKSKILIESINYDGEVLKTATVSPS